MARTDTLSHFLTDVADAIRTKTGSQETIQASSFDTAIENLPSGADLETLTDTITTNTTTTYTPTSGKDGFDSVTITTNVSGGSSEYTAKIDTSLSASSAGLVYKITKVSSDLDTSQVTDFRCFFAHCPNLTEVPQIDTSNGTLLTNMFQDDTNLTTIPVLDFSSAINPSGIYTNCPNFTDQTLDNILVSLVSVGSIISVYKSLSGQGFSSANYPANRIQALPHYQDFIDAGWTIGY